MTYHGNAHDCLSAYSNASLLHANADASSDVLDLKTAPVKVGYIMGSGDAVPEAIRQMGLSVELLNENDLTSGDLSRFDVDCRRDPRLAGASRILSQIIREFSILSRNGGTLIVQYQRPDYAQKILLPFPASMTDTQKTTAGSTARVVDENAKVTILAAGKSGF